MTKSKSGRNNVEQTPTAKAGNKSEGMANSKKPQIKMLKDIIDEVIKKLFKS